MLHVLQQRLYGALRATPGPGTVPTGALAVSYNMDGSAVMHSNNLRLRLNINWQVRHAINDEETGTVHGTGA